MPPSDRRATTGSPLHRILVVTPPGASRDLERATAWPATAGLDSRVIATDDAAHARRTLDAGGIDAIVLAREAVGYHALAADAAAYTARGRRIDYTPDPLPRATDECISGRGEYSLDWALRHLASTAAHPYATLRYGAAIDQIGDLRLPVASADRVPLVILLHGGFWREAYRRDVMAPLAVDLARRGVATWNVEYRRVGGSGGGCPQTFDDVAAAFDFGARLWERHPVETRAPVVLGHSAGGHLALWCAVRRGLPDGTPGASPAALPRLVVGIGAVADLAEARRRGLGNGAVDAFVPRTDDDAWADPRARLPLGVEQLIVHGTEDESVPFDLAAGYVAAARRAGDRVDWRPLAGVSHMPPIDPASDAWRRVVEHLRPHLLTR